ncbi:zinc finger, CCHC-type containing protein [Tanacetum coccineum]
MDAAAMKHMASNFDKLDKFEWVNFRRWQKKMHFLLSSMSVVYMLTTPIPEDGGDDATVDQIRRRNKWDNDDYVCRGLILKDFKHTLKHKKEELTLVELDSHLRIEESLRMKDNDKQKSNNVVGPQCLDMVVLNIVNDNIASPFMSTSKMNDSILWHARLGHDKITKKSFQNVKRESKVLEMIQSDLCDLYTTPSLGNKKYFVNFIDDASRFCYVYLLHSKDETLDKFKVFKTEVELQQGSQIKRFRTDRGGLSQGFWGEAMLTNCYLLNMVLNKRNRITPYELWTKKKPNLNYLRVWGCRAVVRLLDPKLKTLGERGIECIFVGYAEHSKAFRFYVIEPNDSVSINSIIESRDAIFDENRFSSVPRPSQRSLVNRTEDIGCSVVLEEVIEEVVHQLEPGLRKIKRNRTPKDFGPKFQLYLIEGTRNEKEAINDEMDSIMGNNTWVLADLPPSCKPLGCKWFFKRKLKVDETIEKFKARLVIQGFKQKSGIDYFDTYAPVARISSIRLLIAMALIHNLIIHQMDVKTYFRGRVMRIWHST